MIKTAQQYKIALAKCQEGAEQLKKQVEEMKDRGYSNEEIKCLTDCTARMLQQSRQAIDLYCRLKAKDSTALRELPLHRQLIGLRIYLGISQSKLATLLGIPRAELIREERNEYRNLTLDRFAQILRVMGVHHVPTYVQGDWQTVNAVQDHMLEWAREHGNQIIVG